MSPATPLLFSNGIITYRSKRGVGVSPVTPLFTYTLQRKKKREKPKRRLIRWTVSASLFIGIEIQRRGKEGRKNQIRLPMCSETCLSKTPCVF